MKKKIAIIALILVFPLITFAQTPATNGCTDASNSLGKCVNQIYVWSLGIAALLALFMIVIGGYITLTSAGNAQRASAGKSYITSSIIGLVLLFGAYLLLNTINPDLVNFNFDLNNYKTDTTTTKIPASPRSP